MQLCNPLSPESCIDVGITDFSAAALAIFTFVLVWVELRRSRAIIRINHASLHGVQPPKDETEAGVWFSVTNKDGSSSYLDGKKSWVRIRLKDGSVHKRPMAIYTAAHRMWMEGASLDDQLEDRNKPPKDEREPVVRPGATASFVGIFEPPPGRGTAKATLKIKPVIGFPHWKRFTAGWRLNRVPVANEPGEDS